MSQELDEKQERFDKAIVGCTDEMVRIVTDPAEEKGRAHRERFMARRQRLQDLLQAMIEDEGFSELLEMLETECESHVTGSRDSMERDRWLARQALFERAGREIKRIG